MLRGRAFAALGRPKWCAINSFKRRCSGRPLRYWHGAIANGHTSYTMIPEGCNDPSSGFCEPLTSDNAALVLGSSSPARRSHVGTPLSRTRGSVVGHAIQASGRKRPILQAYCSKSAPPVRPSRPEARAALAQLVGRLLRQWQMRVRGRRGSGTPRATSLSPMGRRGRLVQSILQMRCQRR
jgi:hypothetical protein